MVRKYAEIFCWKNVSSFCSAKATHIFSAKNIRILCIESPRTVNEMTLNELVKLTTLWTTGPCSCLCSEQNVTVLVFVQNRMSLFLSLFWMECDNSCLCPWRHCSCLCFWTKWHCSYLCPWCHCSCFCSQNIIVLIFFPWYHWILVFVSEQNVTVLVFVLDVTVLVFVLNRMSLFLSFLCPLYITVFLSEWCSFPCLCHYATVFLSLFLKKKCHCSCLCPSCHCILVSHPWK